MRRKTFAARFSFTFSPLLLFFRQSLFFSVSQIYSISVYNLTLINKILSTDNAISWNKLIYVRVFVCFLYQCLWQRHSSTPIKTKCNEIVFVKSMAEINTATCRRRSSMNAITKWTQFNLIRIFCYYFGMYSKMYIYIYFCMIIDNLDVLTHSMEKINRKKNIKLT